MAKKRTAKKSTPVAEGKPTESFGSIPLDEVNAAEPPPPNPEPQIPTETNVHESALKRFLVSTIESENFPPLVVRAVDESSAIRLYKETYLDSLNNTYWNVSRA